jgi:hypothetical protein
MQDSIRQYLIGERAPCHIAAFETALREDPFLAAQAQALQWQNELLRKLRSDILRGACAGTAHGRLEPFQVGRVEATFSSPSRSCCRGPWPCAPAGSGDCSAHARHRLLIGAAPTNVDIDGGRRLGSPRGIL